MSPCVLAFGWGFIPGWVFLCLPWNTHRPWEMWVKALGALWGGVCGAEGAFPEEDLAFQQLGFVLIKLICAFCLPLLLCVSLYIL